MPKPTPEKYFDVKEEQAVIDYNNATTQEEKDRIYNEILLVPFQKMIQSILRVYPIHLGRHTMEEVEHHALTHLIDHMIIFNPDAITKSGLKTKAYSYCQTIVRNYFRDHGRKTYTEKMVVLSYDECAEEINESSEYSYEMDFDSKNYYEKVIDGIIKNVEDKIANDNMLKKNEIIVGEAIVNILKNWNVLFLEDTPDGKYDKKITNKYQKNKILLFLKEQSSLSTKEIRAAIKPFRDIYLFEKMNNLDD